MDKPHFNFSIEGFDLKSHTRRSNSSTEYKFLTTTFILLASLTTRLLVIYNFSREMTYASLWTFLGNAISFTLTWMIPALLILTLFPIALMLTRVISIRTGGFMICSLLVQSAAVGVTLVLQDLIIDPLGASLGFTVVLGPFYFVIMLVVTILPAVYALECFNIEATESWPQGIEHQEVDDGLAHEENSDDHHDADHASEPNESKHSNGNDILESESNLLEDSRREDVPGSDSSLSKRLASKQILSWSVHICLLLFFAPVILSWP